MRQGKWIAGLLLSISAGLSVTGCFTGGVYQVPEHEPLSRDLTDDVTPRVTRAQQVDRADPSVRVQQLAPIAVAPPSMPPGPPSLASSPKSSLPPPPPPPVDNGITQMSLTPKKNVRVSVRAWVNGKPIFNDDVMQAVPPMQMRDASLLAEPRRSERFAEIFSETLEGIIDQEVAYQDAVHKLEIGNKKALEKLKKLAVERFEKQLKRIRDSQRFTESEIKAVEHVLKRQTERDMISGEYVRSRIFDILNQVASPAAVQAYYTQHLNEFQRLDSVTWQDVFIAISKDRPTLAYAKRFAEELIQQSHGGEGFAKLIQYDEGDSKFRNGEGWGSHRGEIKPPEVEEVLFRLKEGEIGPVVELSTGVHVVKVTKREYAGQMPLDEKTQKLIENKIKGQVFEREYKQLIRELRRRAVIIIEREEP